jgi:hypothetical protein
MPSRMLYRGPSFSKLHEQYAKLGRLDEHAAIQTESHIVIAAPVAQVWAHLIDLPAWPTFDPSFRTVRLASRVSVDAELSFVLRGFPIRARFAVITPERELIWTGASLWFRAVDIHRITKIDEEHTRYSIAESFAGLFAPLVMSRTRLKAQHDTWLNAFRRVVEVR